MKIKSKNETLNNMDLYEERTYLLIYKLLINKFGNNKMKLDNGLQLINQQSPTFFNGYINDFGSGGKEVIGNILYFLINHSKSPTFQNEQLLADILEISLKDFDTYIKARMPQNINKYSKDSIIKEIIPNCIYRDLSKNVPLDTEYLKKRKINEDFIKKEGILNIKDIKNIDFDYNFILSSFIKKFNYLNNNIDNLYDNDKKIFLNSQKEILLDFLINKPNLNKELEKRAKILLLNLLKKDNSDITMEKINKKLDITPKYDFFINYFNIDRLKKYTTLYPYKNNNFISSFTLRIDDINDIDDTPKYSLVGKNVVEAEIKDNGEYLFIIEGKIDKLSTKTMLKKMGILEKSSFITLLNAHSNIPYYLYSKMKSHKKIINLLDNDDAGNEGKENLFSKLFDMGMIEKVSDFSKYNKYNDINDFLVHNGDLNDFFQNIEKYERKIIEPNIKKEKIIYLKNISELRKLLEKKHLIKDNSIFLKKLPNNIQKLIDNISEYLETGEYKNNILKLKEIPKEMEKKLQDILKNVFDHKYKKKYS